MSFAKEITDIRFKKAPKVKINRRQFHESLDQLYLYGKVEICEKILTIMAKEPNIDKDILKGEIQILLTDSATDFKKYYPQFKTPSIERTMALDSVYASN